MASPLGLSLAGWARTRAFSPGYSNDRPFGPEEAPSLGFLRVLHLGSPAPSGNAVKDFSGTTLTRPPTRFRPPLPRDRRGFRTVRFVGETEWKDQRSLGSWVRVLGAVPGGAASRISRAKKQ